MEILSISIDKEALKKLEEVQKRLGFKSRSKMLRSAILSMLKDYDALEALTGNAECVFVLTYKDSEKNNVSNILHKFEEIIETEMHHHHSGTCIDILNVSTTANNVRELFSALKRAKSIYSVTYSIIQKDR